MVVRKEIDWTIVLHGRSKFEGETRQTSSALVRIGILCTLYTDGIAREVSRYIVIRSRQTLGAREASDCAADASLRRSRSIV